MLFRKSRIPRGYMLLEETKHPKPRSIKSAASRLVFWLAASTLLFVTAFVFSEVATAEHAEPLNVVSEESAI